jgi:hypothetical protein
MAAEVEHVKGGRYRAYCPEHQDGRNAGKAACETWADTHNREMHNEGDNNEQLDS